MERVEEDPKSKLLKPATFSCPICYEDLPVEDMVMFDPCDHTYCKSYLASKITSGNCVDMRCPFRKCSSVIQYHEIKALIDAELFAKYDSFALQAALKADSTVRWCPKPGCGIPLFGEPSNPHMRCNCGHEYCYLCSEDWHEGSTCDQYQKWKAEQGLVDRRFAEWSKGNAKKCPQCRATTQKNEGCNHMTCASCKYQWCWLCEGPYQPGHFDITNLRGCPGMQSGSTENFSCLARVTAKTAVITGLALSLVGTFAYSAFMPGNPMSVHGTVKIFGAIMSSTLRDDED